MTETKTQWTRRRAGLYEATIDGLCWIIAEREVPADYGGGWAWYATAEDGTALDPCFTLREAKEAVG